jgi:glycolate oxidase subunit GlcD
MSTPFDGDFDVTLKAAVPAERIVSPSARTAYGEDATFLRGTPSTVVLPESTEEVAATVAACAAAGRPVVARGAGTSLVGGPIPGDGAVVIGLERLRACEVDADNLVAVAGAGVVTGDLQDAAAAHGLLYPPDPGSVRMSTIGGNVACNAGGMRCLKYGVTADHVLGLTVVLADGGVLRLGGRLRKRSSGYRLAQLFTGSEGTLGIVTEAVLKLVPLPRSRSTALVGFGSVEEAAEAVGRLLRSGILPSALELLDRTLLELLRSRLPAGFGEGFGAALIVEQDGGGPGETIEEELFRAVEVLGGSDEQIARGRGESDRLWQARRDLGAAIEERGLTYYGEDVAVPISRIPELVRRVERISEASGMTIATTGHAGDGNLHPLVLFTEDRRPEVAAVVDQILDAAIGLGGTISAEHGIGMLKRDRLALEHGDDAVALMRGLKDLLDPDGRLNPGKVLPPRPARPSAARG